jgi:hypothetical protein
VIDQSVHYPGLPFEVDLRAFLAQHDLNYQAPARVWEDGTPLGNGDLCATLYKPKAFEWGLTKVDVWDHRFDRASAPLTPHDEVMRLVRAEDRLALWDLTDREAVPYSRMPYSTKPQAWQHPPTPKPCGALRLFAGGYNPDFATEVHDHFEQRLSLHEATATTIYSTRYGSGIITSFICATRNLLVVRVKDTPVTAQRRAVELIRLPDPTLGLPRLRQQRGFVWIDYPFPACPERSRRDGFRYVMMARVAGPVRDIERLANGFCWPFGPLDPLHLTVYVAVVTTREANNPVAAARSILEQALADGYDALWAEHTAWWHGFWSRSFLDLSDDYIENLWYLSMYLLASSSRGSQPPPLLGPWFLEDFQPWHGDYHGNVNIQQFYWPVLTANHPELAEPYINTFHAMLPRVKEETREVYGMRGAKFPSMTTDRGTEMGFGWARYWLHVPAWHTRIFWQRYRYTRDRALLAKVAYPVMKAVLTFYEDYISRDEGGTVHIWPSNSSEQGKWWVRDVTQDLAVLRELLAAGIEAAEILGVDADRRAVWQDLLENLAEYPVAAGVILDYEGAPPDLALNHPGLMAPLFPVGEVGPVHPLWETFRHTAYGLLARSGRQLDLAPFNLPTWNDDMSWPWLCCLMARLGDGETARAYLYDLAIWQFQKLNGTFALNAAWTHKQRIRQPAMPNSSGGFAAAVNEMVLQSYDGLIRVFPALPPDWSGRFADLRAVGAFLVSAAATDGAVDWIVVSSEVGGHCHVANPWPGRRAEVRDAACGDLVVASDAPVLAFETRPESSYRLTPADTAWPLEVETVGGQRREIPRVYVGPCYLAQGDYPVYLGKPKTLGKW